MLKTNRGFWKCFFLSLITLGIYGLWMIHKMAAEANLADEQGKKVGGLAFYILMTIVTVGIYSFYWNYRVCEKFADVQRSDGQKEPFTGGSWLLWSIIGSLIVVGPFIALAKEIHSWNASNAVYNKRHPVTAG